MTKAVLAKSALSARLRTVFFMDEDLFIFNDCSKKWLTTALMHTPRRAIWRRKKGESMVLE
jgi:hypothetical protein